MYSTTAWLKQHWQSRGYPGDNMLKCPRSIDLIRVDCCWRRPGSFIQLVQLYRIMIVLVPVDQRFSTTLLGVDSTQLAVVTANGLPRIFLCLPTVIVTSEILLRASDQVANDRMDRTGCLYLFAPLPTTGGASIER